MDRSLDPPMRAKAAQLLPVTSRHDCLLALSQRFLQSGDEADLMPIANIFRFVKDRVAVPALINALNDHDERRRFAAAYALGIPKPGKRAVDALIQIVKDTAESPAIRGVAAESLNGESQAVEPLVSVLSDDAVEVRFWAVWSLGCQTADRTRRSVEPALAEKLSDKAVYPGWWSVAHETLAILSGWNLPKTKYETQFEEEWERIENDSGASAEEKRWAGFWK